MRDKDLEPTFPWTLLFFITGICYFLFAGFLKLLNTNLPGIFFWIGTGSLVLGFISVLGSVLKKELQKSEKLSTAEKHIRKTSSILLNPSGSVSTR